MGGNMYGSVVDSDRNFRRRATWRRWSLFLLLVALVLMASGCVPGQNRYSTSDPAGFFAGIWHGWIAPVTLIWGLFDTVRIYEPVNSGWWYDLGFYMAIVGGFGGLTLTRRKRS